MAYSGTISTTVFDTRRVIDHALRRCRIPAQRITSEMQNIAEDVLYLTLSELASVRTPSWCIEKIILPFYINQPIIPLPRGTVEVLNANYRYLQEISKVLNSLSSTEIVYRTGGLMVSTIGIKWDADSVPVTLSISDDLLVWTEVGSFSNAAVQGEWVWYDISQPLPANYMKITGTSSIQFQYIYLGNTPNEIPMGVLNKDDYVAQNNKIFASRPTTYWFQRNLANPVINVWPAPNAAAEYAQLIVWRHRQIMDVGTLTEELEVPQRWYEAIVAMLASKLVLEVEGTDISLLPVLSQQSDIAIRKAWDGDNDGSAIKIQPWIAPYTK